MRRLQCQPNRAMVTFEIARAAWVGKLAADGGIPAWPPAGVAIEGDFSGIQRFVLRPVPGAGGAARRLRARSFRVLALTRLVASALEHRLRDACARLYYSAGGRFLIVANPYREWADCLASFQGELDDDLLRTYKGELAFHLAGAEFADGRIPVGGLRDAMARRKQTPLDRALRTAGKWVPERFVFSGGDAKCAGCGSTAALCDQSERLCQTCVDDSELGKRLLMGGPLRLKQSPHGSLAVLGERWTVSSDGPILVSAVTHTPLEREQLATFKELSGRAGGRQYLGYLRLDADRIGLEFRKLEGDPRRTWGLSKLLDETFSSAVTEKLRTQFANLYPVYGGGDDLFVIGPWNEVLDFAAAWRSEFRKISEDKLTFSAGVALAKPSHHILTKSEESEGALNDHAKIPRDSIHALGSTISWAEFGEVHALANRVTELHSSRQIKSALLHDIAYLHERWQRGDPRWHSLLFYQFERNLTREARRVMADAFLSPGHLWEHAGFIVRYAMLSGGAQEEHRHA